MLAVPFVPFELFDWLARVLPGAVVTFGIDLIVALISPLDLGELSAVAKAVEQALAVGIFLAAGAALGALLFGLSGTLPARMWYPTSVVLGAAFGLAALSVSFGAASLSATAADSSNPVVSGFWIMLTFLTWGAALAWTYRRLSSASTQHAAEAAIVQRLDRRRFLLRLGGATAVITVAGAGLASLLRSEGRGRLDADAGSAGTWSQRNALPNQGATVEPAPGTRPEFTLPNDHYRIDINLTPPTVAGDQWRLRVGGLVDTAREFTLEELQNYRPMHQFITMSCISNPLGGDLISTTRWTGVSMQRLLPDLGLVDGATHLKISSVDGFFEIVPLETIEADERVMLAYQWDGLPLPTENGFPLRIYVPDVYGMKQPKWIDRIEAIDDWEQGFWVVRGWDDTARMRSTSVIDTVATDMVATGTTDSSPGAAALVPIGGIAHAGARGISRVEVRVDDGDWHEARLRQPLSELTWVIWRYDWPFEAGQHTFTVRCFDGDGTPQITERNPVHPSGATGLISKRARL
ncbi:MAG: molybdopterin-dependent oxidoreductase [Trueperaceae bacterium]